MISMITIIVTKHTNILLQQQAQQFKQELSFSYLSSISCSN